MPRLAALLCILAVAAGCSLGDDSSGTAIEASQLETLVLQPQDLGRPFERFDEGRQVGADAPQGTRADPARFGRVDGWKSRYRRPGTTRTRGPIVVESRVDVFDSADGASDDLDAVEQPGFDELDAPGLGDGARAFQALQASSGSGVRYYLIVWREENATGSLLASGFDGRFTFDNALELARKQAVRMARAAA